MNFNQDKEHLDEIKQAMNDVVDSGQWVNGNRLKMFEKEWAAANSARYCVGVGNGTDALKLGLLALGIGPGDEVITPAFNAAYAAQAIAEIGATNIFCDVDPGTMLLDIDALELVSSPRTRAIVPVHLFGQMVNMERLRIVARRLGAVVVEDAAQVHGAHYGGYPPSYWSDAAAFSHYPTKNLGCIGEGGSLVTNTPSIAKTVSLLRDAGRTDRYIHTLQAGNSMLDEIQAAALLVRMHFLGEQNMKRRRLAMRYKELLKGVGDLTFQSVDSQAYHVYHLLVVRTKRRVGLMDHLKKQGIPCLSHYPCVLTRQPFAVGVSLDQGPFPHSEAAAREVLSLPLYPGMADEVQDIVVDAVKRFYE